MVIQLMDGSPTQFCRMVYLIMKKSETSEKIPSGLLPLINARNLKNGFQFVEGEKWNDDELRFIKPRCSLEFDSTFIILNSLFSVIKVEYINVFACKVFY